MKFKNVLLFPVLLISLLVFGSCVSTGTSTIPATTTLSALTNTEVILENIYTRVNPSVVNINVLENVTVNPDFQIPGFSFSDPGQQYTQGLGSGFLWDDKGHIVTNNHVVENADNISVTFYDGTTVPGRLVGADADSDLAVIKVDMPDDQIKPVEMADSSQLKVGQTAIAIGNPFGLQSTMTTGIVSGLGRVLPANENALGASYSIPDIIQTDASINPGNSGGVLLDLDGKVIGVTSSIATTSGSNAGVGFAIPSNIVQQVVPALISTGHYDHPYLGLSLISVTPEIASAMNLPSGQRGVLIENVTGGGPGDKAGLKGSDKQITVNGQQIFIGGDVVIAYNGQTVKSSGDLITFLARSGKAGETATLTVLREDKQVDVPVILGIRPGLETNGLE